MGWTWFPCRGLGISTVHVSSHCVVNLTLSVPAVLFAAVASSASTLHNMSVMEAFMDSAWNELDVLLTDS